MSLSTVANRYARSLADVSGARGETQIIAQEVNAFTQLLDQNTELREVFASPIVALDRKRAILNDVLARVQFKTTTNNFLQTLLSNQRLQDLHIVNVSLAKELDERRGMVSAEVTTARALTAAEQETLVQQLRSATGKEVRVAFKVDPEVIGGVVARIGSLIYDGSIKNQLALMKQQLSKE